MDSTRRMQRARANACSILEGGKEGMGRRDGASSRLYIRIVVSEKQGSVLPLLLQHNQRRFECAIFTKIALGK